jgi:hypothetical protein
MKIKLPTQDLLIYYYEKVLFWLDRKEIIILRMNGYTDIEEIFTSIFLNLYATHEKNKTSLGRFWVSCTFSTTDVSFGNQWRVLILFSRAITIWFMSVFIIFR